MSGAPLPSGVLVQRVDKILACRYRLQTDDRQDVIAAALLACVRASKVIRTNMNGFFRVVACRRACDFCRRKSRKDDVVSQIEPPEPGREFEERILLEEVAERFFADKSPREKRRALQIVRSLLAGAGFSEACRTAGIPLGSRTRYRSALQRCFQNVLHWSPSRTPPPSRVDKPSLEASARSSSAFGSFQMANDSGRHEILKPGP